ncbi:MAG: hypothetical protein EOR60_15060 [Mesorhizobium sp.]|nr:MAG: hypothetical protein EOR60_15060 [Mesorhizobium sp.]
MSKIEQNRLGIQLALESLRTNRFTNIAASQPQGTFPSAHITAERDGVKCFIGVTSREEIGAEGEYNPCYNLVKTAADLKEARRQAQAIGAVPGFVMIALNRSKGRFSAYYGTLERIGIETRCVPMLPQNRLAYELLADREDSRIVDI